MTEEIQLTKRQREVLELIADGKTTKQVAYTMKIAQRTVMAHLSDLKKKLGAETRAHAVMLAVRKGWLQ